MDIKDCTRLVAVLWLLLTPLDFAEAEDLAFRAPTQLDDPALDRAIPDLANRFLASNSDGDTATASGDLFWIQLAAGDYSQAETTIATWRIENGHPRGSAEGASLVPLELYADARARAATVGNHFDAAFREAFQTFFASLDDQSAYTASSWLGAPPLETMRKQLIEIIEQRKGDDHIQRSAAVDLCRRYALIRAYEAIRPLTDALVTADRANRYVIDDDVLVKLPNGATINAMIVRPKVATPLPTALQFTIYTYPWMLSTAIEAAARGYVGVVGFTRGKRHSPDPVIPFERDGEDVRALIEWIGRQSWSDGRVGMYGGSYNAFTQWAAVKRPPEALKTIVPYVAEDPGLGVPMNNNVFLTANYAWPFYTTDGKDLDDKLYYDNERWNKLGWNWYRSGRPYRQIDQVDGLPNPWLQRWLNHPSYDSYWAGMTANGDDYKRLDIPVLAIDGYYDDGQNNAVRRLLDHNKHRPNAEHYLVIGPYDHLGAQGSNKAHVLRGYEIDPVAQFDTSQLTFEWFDYIFKQGTKPALLQDKVNYQVMGTNVWRHAPSIAKMSDETLTLYLTNTLTEKYYRLASKGETVDPIGMTVDFKDRTTTSADTYPSEIVSKHLNLADALAFISDPFDTSVSVNGLFSGSLRTIVNKKDLDIALALYEVMPSGEYFHLSDTIQRASYAADMSKRRLLTPGKVEVVTLDRTLLVSRQLSKGSRLLVVLDVNRGPFAQVNYGTGKDVSDESIADATKPLVVQWLPGSYINVPISRRSNRD